MQKKRKKHSTNENKTRLTLSAIEREYGLNKRLVDKYLPRPEVEQYPTRHGSWHYARYWNRDDVEAALDIPEIKEQLERKQQDRLRQQYLSAATDLLASCDPESMVERGKSLKRAFVLHVGPTNSGKTYEAINALKSASTGTYLGPLRLLALEMYDRINADGIKCSLLTGEEHITEEGAAIVSSTIELCDYSKHYQTAVIDEAQLITDPDRGSAWLSAICMVNADEVHICLAPEARGLIENLVSQFGDPYAVIQHKRLVPLEYAGECKGYKDIRKNDAVICFSRKNVLSTAALLEKQGHKASVIYGALPPIARRNEVSRYLSGETDIIVATDAIGMGVSLPIKRIVFAETQKFDGTERRPLSVSEIKQIAGRAGRFGMFDKGEVLTMNSPELIESALSYSAKSVRRLCIGFPRETLNSELPMEILLRAWQKLPYSKSFLREDMTEPLRLLSALGQMAEGKDRNLIYDLITCPVDTNVRELVFYWRDCARAILFNRRIPRPHFGTETLEECELQYKAYDIRHQLMQRLGMPDNTDKERQEICERIKVLMQKDKSEFIRHCRICGKELPLGNPSNICENCFRTGSF